MIFLNIRKANSFQQRYKLYSSWLINMLLELSETARTTAFQTVGHRIASKISFPGARTKKKETFYPKTHRSGKKHDRIETECDRISNKINNLFRALLILIHTTNVYIYFQYHFDKKRTKKIFMHYSI